MEDRFKMWLSVCLKTGQVTPKEFFEVTGRNQEVCLELFKAFTDYDSSAIADFVFDCAHDIGRKANV